MGVEVDGGYLPLGWAGRTGTGEDSALKSVLPTPEPQIGLLLLFPGGCLEVLWYWGGSLGTQGWYPNCFWPLAALLLETACPRAVQKGKKQQTLSVLGPGCLHCSPGSMKLIWRGQRALQFL